MRMRSTGALRCGSLGLAWIAAGGFEAFVDFTGKTKFFDVCAGLAILEAAGGVYEYVSVNNQRLLIAASSREMLEIISKILST